jgi:hypothetical protein
VDFEGVKKKKKKKRNKAQARGAKKVAASSFLRRRVGVHCFPPVPASISVNLDGEGRQLGLRIRRHLPFPKPGKLRLVARILRDEEKKGSAFSVGSESVTTLCGGVGFHDVGRRRKWFGCGVQRKFSRRGLLTP